MTRSEEIGEKQQKQLHSTEFPGIDMEMNANNARNDVEMPIQQELVHIILYYLYVEIPEASLTSLREALLALSSELSLLGRIRLAPEGINGSVCGTERNIAAYKKSMQEDETFKQYFRDIVYKDSVYQISENGISSVFDCLQVIITKEVTSTGAMANVDMKQFAGGHLTPEEFHKTLEMASDDLLLLDTRNFYEVAVGKFKNAIDPKIRSFSQFATFAEQNLSTLKTHNVLMYCTGGVRCEKAAAYLRSRGCSRVSQLQGGIHCYMETYPDDRSLFEGGCTVFDKRRTMKTPATLPIGHCVLCGNSWDQQMEGRRCINCRALVLWCDDCLERSNKLLTNLKDSPFDPTSHISSDSKMFPRPQLSDSISPSLSQLPIYCEEHILMDANDDMHSLFFSRFSSTALLSKLQALQSAIDYAVQQSRGKGRRHRNRRHQLSTQFQIVQQELINREQQTGTTFLPSELRIQPQLGNEDECSSNNSIHALSTSSSTEDSSLCTLNPIPIYEYMPLLNA